MGVFGLWLLEHDSDSDVTTTVTTTYFTRSAVFLICTHVKICTSCRKKVWTRKVFFQDNPTRAIELWDFGFQLWSVSAFKWFLDWKIKLAVSESRTLSLAFRSHLINGDRVDEFDPSGAVAPLIFQERQTEAS